MSSRQTFGRSRIAATGALGLALLLAVGGIAQSRVDARDDDAPPAAPGHRVPHDSDSLGRIGRSPGPARLAR